MIDRKALLDDLKQQVKAVEADLGKQVKALGEVGARLRAEYDQARKLGRTAATWNSWLDERVTQVAVAWVLGTVFVRFCEDNRLIPEPYLTGPDGDRRELAEARYDAYVESDDDPTYRGWLEKAFEELGQGQAGRLLFDKRHNPLYQVPLSHDGARELVEFWRQRDEAGVLVHDFTDPLNEDGTEGWDTRFLGDLYQDLSEAARKTYALLQTPEFVEEFILDRTMNPAVREFGYEGLKMIDPTCGSGHFVLGAFRRLVRLWAERQPGRDVHERVWAALDSVHGVDVNPFAVAIARFRLLVAAMAASGVRTLAEASKYEWPIHLAVGDSLIKHRHRQGNLFEGVEEVGTDELADFKYETEDVHEHPEILRPGRYHVVVGNPPYIQVTDKNLNAVYRDLYASCFGLYSFSVPFAERFFDLAYRAGGQGYGYVGQITASSFMKRKFGKRLIEEFFANNVELTEVIDTSGAYIPGHGTPTVIMIGRPRSGEERDATIRTVMSIQGEPCAPSTPAEGFVWQAIVKQIDLPGSESQWVSAQDVERTDLSSHPWSLSGGGAAEVREAIESASASTVGFKAWGVGFDGDTHADEAFTLPSWGPLAKKSNGLHALESHRGDHAREWTFTEKEFLAMPYDKNRELLAEGDLNQEFIQHFWPLRSSLWHRTAGSKGNYLKSGFSWWQWHRLPKNGVAHTWAIPYSFVATHNHFVLDRGGKVFNRSAPIIKLPASASAEDHFGILGALNSSTACFWLKQVSHNAGSTVDSQGARQSTVPFEDFYQFTGGNVERFPLPAAEPTALAAALENLSRTLTVMAPPVIFSSATPTVPALRQAESRWHSTRARMIALQEELDWQVYSLYNLHSEDLRVSEDPDDPNIPELALGERAFEIVLARRVAAGEASDEWFKRHGSTPITEIPGHWPAPYREIVQKRIDAIESNRAIGMVERPEYKRRWATEGWDALQKKALRSWLLDRMENRDLWFDENGQSTILTLARLTDALSRDEDFVSVAKLYAPRKELAKVVAELITDEHVPFLSALRYKPSGLKKRADWEEVWDLQRKEDAAPDELAKRKIRDSIPVPPKYTSADFLRPSYWKARGKLDVPKERFISYGQTNAATPELYGWAGWNHREQAQALATYFTNTALTTEEITPFLAGLLELQPWLYQWHNEFDMLYSGSPADFFAGYRQQKQGEHGLTDDDLRGWRPPAATRGRRAAAKQ
ncbi:BREX-2 system adenine-specific DNA-methyltransferase PglX [Streptomyces salinarius]|uniref:BREX-2 system adenine-specific DNA-methyltransferase PglX n=1 Tax=Streptomyces TaxID=1883 RepID=UPI0018D776B5|nr:BREX-2 system adenine-specific DNA-methyltransferase PglX [Streptomyces sp. HB-N217]MBH5128844.1 BREX-2 system adenine-specific DNA-methyltransferase PglX [Streptomyces sp. HB-N217]